MRHIGTDLPCVDDLQKAVSCVDPWDSGSFNEKQSGGKGQWNM